MNRRSIHVLAATAAFGLAMLPAGALAQQKTLKEQLVGAWIVVSNASIAANGARENFYGASPKGVLIFDASGRYALVQGKPDRPKLKSASRFDLDATPAELKAVLLSFAANAGTWSVNEADKTLTRRYETAVLPNNEGAEFKATVAISGDELKLVQDSPVTKVRTEAVYRRAK